MSRATRRKRNAPQQAGTPHPRKRQRRAAVEDIYRGCKPFGTCPPDVLNRVENTTWADRLLQWFSSVIYLGGLGIGTGRGTGGGTGYRPLGSGAGSVEVGAGTRTVRPPPLLVDTLGPVDAEVLEMIPLQPLEPTAPSVVSGSDPGVLVTPGGSLPAEIPGIVDGGGPTDVITARDPAVLHIGQNDVGDTHVITQAIERPGFTGSSRDSFYIVGGGRGAVVGEEIELEVLPRTSTPEKPGDIFQTGLGAQRYEQVYVDNPLFLDNARELVAFGDTWDDATDSITFEPVVASPQAAPDSRFTDVVYLGRRVFERGPEGSLRVGRVGRRGTISTRRGTQIGGQVHFFYDLSPIEPEAIELTGFNPPESFTSPPEFESTNQSETAFSEVDLQSEPSSYSDIYLLEEDTVSINGHLVFSEGNGELLDDPQTVSVPLRGRVHAGYVFVFDTVHPITSTSLAPSLQPPVHPGTPEVVIDIYPHTPLAFLHHRRKRKRGSSVFFADVLLAF
ncbi:putative L2 late protein [Equus caballus papillomavirus 6]|uniref:Minor capsid protein L2 n=1 Tax=Equus caballus papillomavirus 6 TaxID=1235427 RepID=M4HWY7_9PAPI|nr:putative L2 late protein [Equus caballus papillomavirus 6]AFU07685.1 putative L2 late protein [Equus caballus papillomavirus 6]